MRRILLIFFVLFMFTSLAGEEKAIEFNTSDLSLRMHSTNHSLSNVRNIAILFIRAANDDHVVIDNTSSYNGVITAISKLYLDTVQDKATYSYLLYCLSSSKRIRVRYRTDIRPAGEWNDPWAAAITCVEILE